MKNMIGDWKITKLWLNIGVEGVIWYLLFL